MTASQLKPPISEGTEPIAGPNPFEVDRSEG